MNKKLISLLATAVLVPTLGLATGTCGGCYIYDSNKEILTAPSNKEILIAPATKDKMLTSAKSTKPAILEYDQVKESIAKNFGDNKQPTVGAIIQVNNQKLKVIDVSNGKLQLLPCTVNGAC